MNKFIKQLVLSCLIGIFLSLNINAQSSVKNWEFGGYIKDMQSAIVLPKSNFSPISYAIYDNLLHNRLNFAYYPTDMLSFEINLRTRIFWGDQVRLQSANYIDLLNESNDYFNLSYGEADSLGIAFHSMIDRLYLDYTIGNWQFRAGRQRINWGINTVWNPNDIFNAYSFTDFDYEEKPGSDALLIKYYFNFASSIEFAIKAFDEWEETTAGLLYKWNAYEYDFQLMTGYMKEHLVFGGGWAGHLWDTGFKGEFSYFSALNDDEEDGFAMTLGLDYVFKNSLYVMLGYLYNHSGDNNQSLAGLFEFDLSAKNLYPYQHATFASISYPFNPLLNGGLAIIYSPVKSHPIFINPSISYSLSNDLDFGIFGQLIFEKDEKFVSPVQAFFIRFKYSF